MSEKELKEMVLSEFRGKNEIKLKKLKKKILSKLEEIRWNDEKEALEVVLPSSFIHSLTHSLTRALTRLFDHLFGL